jgi:hypothetical protein
MNTIGRGEVRKEPGMVDGTRIRVRQMCEAAEGDAVSQGQDVDLLQRGSLAPE